MNQKVQNEHVKPQINQKKHVLKVDQNINLLF